MPKYRYKGRHYRGKEVTGKLRAPTGKDARLKLCKKGVTVTQIQEVVKKPKPKKPKKPPKPKKPQKPKKQGLLQKELTIGQRVKLKEFVIYLRQFSTLLEAGISVVDATNILADQTSNKTLRKVLGEIEGDLQAGHPFSYAASKHRKIFPPLFINMVKAGELGGNLDEILDRLAVYYEKQHRTRQKVVSAMSYPLVVGAIAFVIVFFLLTFVVPTFADMFASFGSELPLITQLVLQAGDVFTTYWWLIIGAVIGLVLLIKFLRDNKKTKFYFDLFLLRIPIFGKLLQKAALARMTRTLSSLFASSVPVLQAVSIVERILGNEVLSRVIRQSRSSLEKGESIAGPMQQHWAFPPLITQMISVGEKTGALDVMLEKVAQFYEDEVEATTDQIKSLIEPLMIVFLAGIVGIIVAAIAIPMFQIFDTIQ